MRWLPQLSMPDTIPHSAPKRAQKAGLLSGVQPDWFAMHVCPVPVQVPQLATVRMAPQLSAAVSDPHSALCAVQKAGSLWGVQPQWFESAPPPPQVVGGVQVPQL